MPTKEKLNKKNYQITAIFVVIIALQVVFLIQSCKWSSFGGDEVFSYGLANNTDSHLFMDQNWIEDKSNETGWITAKDIKDYLVVNEGETFDLSVVWDNQKKDVHPPFYYLLIHSLSSFFPETFSLAIGRGLNILIFVIFSIVLFQLSKMLFGKDIQALMPCILFGFSYATILLTSYIRMYLLLCLFCLLLTTIHVKFLKENRIDKKGLILLLGVVILGGLTHYYFFVFMGIQCGVFCLLVLLKKKKIATLFPYGGVIALGGTITICIFPNMIKHIFFGYRGKEIQENLLGGKLDSFNLYFNIIMDKVFNEKEIIMFFFVAVGAVLCFLLYFKHNKQKEIETPDKDYSWRFIMISFIGYFFCISYISVIKLWTYISPAYVLAMLLFIKVLLWEYEKLPKILYNMVIGLIIFVFIGALAKDYIKPNLESLESSQLQVKLLNENAGRDCLFVYQNWDNLFNNKVIELLQCDEILPISAEETDSLDIQKILEGRNTKDSLIVFLNKGDKEISLLQSIDTQTNYVSENLFETGNFMVYLLGEE